MFQRWIAKMVVTVIRWFGARGGMIHIKTKALRPGRILVYLPSSLDSARLSSILRSLKSMLPLSRFDFLTDEWFPDALASRIREKGKPFAESRLYNIEKKDIRWYRLLKPELIEELQGSNYDLAIDFDVQFNLTMAHALGHSGAPVTIGYYQPAYEDVFHNVLLKSPQPARYDQLLFGLLEKIIE